jgi:hypothetical protein
VKKVLAISPYFPPANTPDMQRLRMALPYFAENGWEVTVAAADSGCHAAPRDEALSRTVPPGTRVLHLPCWSEATSRGFGFGHLSASRELSGALVFKPITHIHCIGCF